MLEQAIIDAEALREAATKNAETLVLEKYSNQIKESIESLLEQAPAPGLEADLGLGPDMDSMSPAADMGLDSVIPDVSSVMEHIPFAATSLDEEQIEIPLDKLLEELDNLKEAFVPEGYETEGLDEDLDEDLDEELDLEEGLYLEEEKADMDLLMAYAALLQQEDPHGFEKAGGQDELIRRYNAGEIDIEAIKQILAGTTNEELDLDEELIESLVVDIHPVKSGWAGTPSAVIQLAEEEILALEQDSEVREQKAALRAAVKKLTDLKESKEKEKNELLSTLEKTRNIALKLQNVVEVLEEKLDKATVANAKLLYQNKALESDSLNERQKQKLVEAVSNAETIEEAKVIFETLQNTVGSTSHKTQPNSLSEAIQKSSSVILSARKENSGGQKANPTLNRWKFLAGIDKPINS